MSLSKTLPPERYAVPFCKIKHLYSNRLKNIRYGFFENKKRDYHRKEGDGLLMITPCFCQKVPRTF